MYKEINLPQNLKINVKSKSVLIRLKEVKNIVSFKSVLDKSIEFYGNGREIKFYLEDFSALRELSNLRYNNLKVEFDVNEKSIKLLKEYKEFIHKFDMTATFDSAVKPHDVVETIMFLSNLGIKSSISYDLFKNFDKKLLDEITRKVVLNPQLVKDVEPFASFVRYVEHRALKRDVSESMGDSFKDKIDSFMYIADDGYATISKRWDKRSRYLFHLDEAKKHHTSELYKEIDSYEQNLFFKNLECAMCNSYEYCQAYLKFEDGKYDCTGFLEMLSKIEENLDLLSIKDDKAA